LHFERVYKDITIRVARIKSKKFLDDKFLITFAIEAKGAAKVVGILTAGIWTRTNGHLLTLDDVSDVLDDNAPISVEVAGSKGFHRHSKG
jgi:hypothetical protein